MSKKNIKIFIIRLRRLIYKFIIKKIIKWKIVLVI